MKAFPKVITIGEMYGPAMKITDQAEADEYFAACVEHSRMLGHSQDEAVKIISANLGYYAGYYDSATRERVERLFRCAHPVFGSIAENGAPSPEAAFDAGIKMARGAKP